MKKLVMMSVIFVLVLSACTSRNRRRENPIQKVTDLVIDSCRYDQEENILYFSAGDIVVKRMQGDDMVVVGTDTINEINEYPTLKRIITILDGKCTSEPYSSTCLRRFKELIQKEPLDSSFVTKLESGDYYDFYLPHYKVSISVKGYIPFESKGEIYVTTVNIVGESVIDFCSSKQEWSYEQKNEILQQLLSKKGKKPLEKDEPKFVLYNN